MSADPQPQTEPEAEAAPAAVQFHVIPLPGMLPTVHCPHGWYDRKTGPLLCDQIQGHSGRHSSNWDAGPDAEGRIYWGRK